MKFRIIMAALVAAFLAAVAGVPAAHAAAGSASVDFLNNYVWRGQKLSDDNGVVQPSLDISHRGFAANYWANFDLDTGENTETDFTLSYSTAVKGIEGLEVGAGYIHYGLDGAPDTQEFYISVAYGVFLNPSVTLYYDSDEGDGGFVIAGVSHSLDLARDMALNLGFTASVNLEDRVMGFDSTGKEFTGFYNGEVSGSVTIPVFEGVTIEPKVAWSFPLTNDARDAIESLNADSQSSIVHGGVNFTYAF
ncbi:MAG: TorF family putative porin [Thermodesulfobacteriota bacterium]